MATTSARATPPKLVPPNRRRDKPQLSCNLCRRRKLRCDRSDPCCNCTKRGLTCTYACLPNRSSNSKQEENPDRGLFDRISQLEVLVNKLQRKLDASQGAEAVKSPRSPRGRASNGIHDGTTLGPELADEQLTDTFGRMCLREKTSKYVSESHWGSMLDDLGELEDLESNKGDVEMKNEEGPELLYGNNRASRQQILSSLPQRAICDSMIDTFFMKLGLASGVLHQPTFAKEYAAFWDNPADTPIMWIGILYSVLCVVKMFEAFMGGVTPVGIVEPARTYALVAIGRNGKDTQCYRQRAAQCLVMGKYLKGDPYTVEGLLLYSLIEYLLSPDSPVGAHVLFSILARVAIRMGYHRDPSHFPKISALQGEIRRRVWAFVCEGDLLVSFAVGLPRSIKESISDTGRPSNFLDGDIDESMHQLPAPRPLTEYTPVLFNIHRRQIGHLMGEILDLMNSPTPKPYSEIMRLDSLLCETVSDFPECLRFKPGDEGKDCGYVHLCRMYLDEAFNKARCILHRKHLVAGRTLPQYAFSRSMCLEAALNILKLQISSADMTVSGVAVLGIALELKRWKLYTIVNQNHLLATTILCVDLYRELLQDPDVRQQPPSLNNPTVIGVLKHTYGLLEEYGRMYQEPQRVMQALGMVLEKAEKMNSDTYGHCPLYIPDNFDTATAASASHSSSSATYVPTPALNSVGSVTSVQNPTLESMATPNMFPDLWSFANFPVGAPYAVANHPDPLHWVSHRFL
ncbi:hypothetical protein P152DRAFT_456046 [Eremomyces bilateralis CBS 781.70]|uniref:Zn(2)-C6 fungal-type domain-containing protein n=1 Tax=Eremomyces bilateralis CBS 781.70 TaxID=1392243 RepID=A0A6G1GAH5_9PEZI|nr:uncharacterized protein P152DRAFT_456046 [Eremomyces bilateralis CBS 781.70]KAF1815012.1 hypothetical protein P152DRAFT_456046 [Eremomyces bilateralis CBS 781.70]